MTSPRTYLILIILLISCASSVHAQQLVLADSVGKWSADQQFDAGNGITLKIRNRIMKHFGTTCMYEFYVLNTSGKQMNSWMGFVKGNTIYEATAVQLTLRPNYETTFKMEFRECLKRRQKDPILSCGACIPVIGFIGR
jgi:hypothetical protein